MNFSVVEPREPRLLVQRLAWSCISSRHVDGRMHVDLDHAGIGRDVQHFRARVARRRVAFDGHGRPSCATAVSSTRREQRDVGLEALDRRHEHVQMPVAHLQRQRGLDHLARLVAAHARPLPARRSSRLGSASRGANGSTANSGSCFLRQHVGQRRQRQAQAERRVARQREELPRAAAATDSTSSRPPPPGSSVGAQRQHEAASAPTGRARSSRARRARSSGSREVGLHRVGVDRQRGFGGQQPRHVLVRGDEQRRRQAAARRPVARRTPVRSRPSTVPGLVVSAIRSSCRHSGSPSARQMSPSAQRGSGSPGYHLPWPKCTKPFGAKRARRRFSSISPSSRFFGRQRGVVPLGAVHVVDRHERGLAALRQAHVVRERGRGRPARRARRSRCHCASLNGLVTRGSSCTRVTLIAKSNSTLDTSV